MITGRQLNMEDYWAILRRRLWMVIIPALLGPMVAYLIAKHLTPRYTSGSMILIEEPKVPASFVPSVVGNDLTARLAHMEEQILSRSRLQPIIEQYGLYRNEGKQASMEALVAEMRKDIVIKPVAFSKLNQPNSSSSSDQENQVPGFEVSFTADTPQAAQSVCTLLTSMFVNANLTLREQQSEGTANFIENQLQQAKQKLDDQDARLAAFKRQYFGSLPDQEQSTIQIAGTLTGELNSLTDAMGRYQEDRTYSETLLTQQMAAWKATQTGSNPETLQEQLARLEDELANLRTQYTDNYPDVIKAQKDIAFVKKEIAQQAAAQARPGNKKAAKPLNAVSEPPEIRRLKAQLYSLQMAIEENQHDQVRVRKAIAYYQAKLKMTPAVEQQYKDITRNYQTALAFYDSLLAKEDESQMSTSLEKRQEGELFTVLDPADLPLKPSYPDYLRFAGGGLVAGLLLGLAVALGLEMRDKALRDEHDIEFFLGVPTLALIPEARDGHPKRLAWLRKTKRRVEMDALAR